MKHGNNCDTEIYLQSEDQEYITREALRFSRAYDIVNSPLWANLKEENGLDGHPEGIVFSDEWLQNLSKARKGVPKSKEHCESISKSLTGISLSKEHREKLSKAHIGMIMGLPSLETRRKMSISNRGQKRSKETCENIGKAVAKTWIVIDPDGNEQVIISLNKFCKENNLDVGNMAKVAKGKYKHHKGWKCKRYENKK